ncbi:selenium cofactor biosynthesis protein YqeC [Candidatus Neomarinimicrobiota bacterium]
MDIHLKASHRKFAQILGDRQGSNGQLCAAVFGAGGKSGLLRRLGGELASEHRNVLLTSLTHSEKFDGWITLLASDMTDRELMTQLGQGTKLHLLNAKIGPSKYSGISPELLRRVRDRVDICLFECDGARGSSLKAHNETDPSVPPFVSQVIVVVGADIINTTVEGGLVHRPQLFCQLWNLANSSLLSAVFVTRVVTSKHGYGSKIPDSVPRVYFVNKADTHPVEAEQLAKMIGRLSGFPAYMGSAKAGWCISVA